jgi:hypothetical protein
MIASDSDYFLLELKLSNIIDAGLGVFTKVDFEAEIIVAEYRGTVFLSEFKDKVLFLNNRGATLNNDSIIAGNNCVAGL